MRSVLMPFDVALPHDVALPQSRSTRLNRLKRFLRASSHPLGMLAGLALLGACSAAEQTPVFGGEGASIQAKQTPLAAAPPEVDTGPCAKPAPPSDVALIEDFEDTDNQLFKVFGREGWWYVAVDGTAGEVFPSVGSFKATALPENEATVQNRYALYGKAEGFKDWGVVWGTTTRWVDEGLKCPFNASKFVGFTFRARGKGQLHLKIGNPTTVPQEYGGKCKEKCWDSHGQRFFLTEQWQPYVVRWDRVQQGGWGAQAPFDPERIINLNFAVDGKDLPVEFWLDDLQFVREGEALPTQLNPSGDKLPPSPIQLPGADASSAPGGAASGAVAPAPAPRPSASAQPQPVPAAAAP